MSSFTFIHLHWAQGLWNTSCSLHRTRASIQFGITRRRGWPSVLKTIYLEAMVTPDTNSSFVFTSQVYRTVPCLDTIDSNRDNHLVWTRWRNNKADWPRLGRSFLNCDWTSLPRWQSDVHINICISCLPLMCKTRHIEGIPSEASRMAKMWNDYWVSKGRHHLTVKWILLRKAHSPQWLIH